MRAFRAALEQDRVASAYLLHGPEGVGRSLGATLFATVLLCEAPREAGPCGRCRACRWNRAGTHPDFLVVSAETGPAFKDDAEAERARLDVFTWAARRAARAGPRRAIHVRTLRRLLDLLALAPAGGGRKVALLDAFDEIEEEGTATLLKSLEEAPPRTTFLVLARGVDSVPETILSRCQRLRFRPLDPAVVRRLLAAGAGSPLDEASADLLVRLAQGSAGRAIRAAAMGAHAAGLAAARDLVAAASPAGADTAAAWVAEGGARELAGARERLRELAALALLLARDRCAAEREGLDALVPPLRQALESCEANVTPELVVRGLWARVRRARMTS